MTPMGRPFLPLALADKMADKTGRTQGESTVAIPAKKQRLVIIAHSPPYLTLKVL